MAEPAKGLNQFIDVIFVYGFNYEVQFCSFYGHVIEHSLVQDLDDIAAFFAYFISDCRESAGLISNADPEANHATFSCQSTHEDR